MRRNLLFTALAAATLAACQSTSASTCAPSASEESLSDSATAAVQAWRALDLARSTNEQNDYQAARETGMTCANLYRPRANRRQQEDELLDSQEPDSLLPVFGPGPTCEVRTRQFARGPLNDVAACLFVELEAEVWLKDSEAAAATFCQLSRYSYASIWDPTWRGFWDPIEAAEDVLIAAEITPPQCTDSD